jgi:hypothetical protein
LCLTAVVGAARDSDDDAEAGEVLNDAAESAPRERPPRIGSLLCALWPVAADAFRDSAAAARERDPAVRTRSLRGGPLLRVPLHWRPTPMPAPFAPAVAGALSESPRDLPVFDWVSETARHVGSLVHAELARLRLDTVKPAAADAPARTAQYQRWLALRGVPRERLAAAAARADAALNAVHDDPRGRWILDESHRAAVREYAVSGPWRGEIVNVVFDRMFIDAAGVRWIIDYKTSEHLGGGREDFLDREQERYRAQLRRYADLARRLGPEPVRVGLYFPLMRAWREWDPQEAES